MRSRERHPNRLGLARFSPLLLVFAVVLTSCGGSGGRNVPPLTGERYVATCECTDLCLVAGTCTPGTSLLPIGYSRTGDWCIDDDGLSNSQIRTGVLTRCTFDARLTASAIWGSINVDQALAGGHGLICEVGHITPPEERNNCSNDLGASPVGLSAAPLLIDSDGRTTEPAHPGYTNASVASGPIDRVASRVTIYYDGAPTEVIPTGYVSIRRGYCPRRACPVSVEGVSIELPTFRVGGSTVSAGKLYSFGSWDGDKFGNETYEMYGTSNMVLSGMLDGRQYTDFARSREKINGSLVLSSSRLPPPLSGEGRYATVSGLFRVNERVEMKLSLVAVFERGAPTPSVSRIVQPPCGTSPCDGITYDARGSRTWGGRRDSLRYSWVDANYRLVGTGPTLDSQVVDRMRGTSGWPVTLRVQEVIYDPPPVGLEFPVARPVGPYGEIVVGPMNTVLSGSRFTGEFGVEKLGSALARGYFNGDSYEDLVIGVPQDWESDGGNGGSVRVVYGGRPDLRNNGDMIWRLTTPGAADRFGAALAVGDFNGDGRQDIAASAPGRFSGTGAIYIRYGTATGLSTTVAPFASGELRGTNAPGWLSGGTGFGTTLLASDVNGDGATDLIVGMPSHNGSRGAVWVYYGKRGVGISTRTGTAVRAPHRLTVADAGGTESVQDLFGLSLAEGDFDNDGISDIAVGAPGQDQVSSSTLRYPNGRVAVFYGAPTGLSGAKRQILRGSGRFGAALASGDFDGDGFSDLAVGSPRYMSSAFIKTGGPGEVSVFRGSSTLLGGRENYRQSASDPDGAGCRVSAAGDRFGLSLAAARIDEDDKDDLIVGAIHARNAARDQFFILQTGVASPLGRLFHMPNERCLARSLFNIPNATTSLGKVITTVDVTNDGRRDIAIGSPDIEGGRVYIIPNHPSYGLGTRTYLIEQSIVR